MRAQSVPLYVTAWVIQLALLHIAPRLKQFIQGLISDLVNRTTVCVVMRDGTGDTVSAFMSGGKVQTVRAAAR